MDHPELTRTLSASGPKRKQGAIHAWGLEVLGGPAKGSRVTTLDALLRVGSDPSSDLVLADPTVSRAHLEIERTPKGLLVRDLGSHNGTWISHHRILSAYVENGDVLLVGKTRLKIHVEAKATEVQLEAEGRFGELVGESERMRQLFADLRRLSTVDVPVLLEGETGTGKELAARALHCASMRKSGPFEVVDCSLLGSTAEITLFGDATGPEPMPGAFERARGGTLFLDEIGEIPLDVQPKLLRAIETGRIPRPGNEPLEVDVRVVSATQKNMDEEVRADRFRKDLFFRVAGARVRLPPLRAHKEDLPLLARRLAPSAPELSAQALSLLESYDWPGNVRELRNLLEQGALSGSGPERWLPRPSESEEKAESAPPPGLELAALPYHEAKDRAVGAFERVYFSEILRACEYDLARAGERTGLSVQSLYRLLKKNGLRLKQLKNAGDV